MLEFIIFPPIYFTKPQKMKKRSSLKGQTFWSSKDIITKFQWQLFMLRNQMKKVERAEQYKKKSHVVQCPSCSAYLTYTPPRMFGVGCFWLETKGQLISKGLFGVFNSPKKRTKNVCPSRLGQNFEFSSSFFGRIEDTKKAFRN